MSLVDVHLHSTFSDGIYTPTQLVEQALAAKLTVIALTDHDTLNGVPEFFAAGHKAGLQVIPGVELGSQDEEASVHILGYGVRSDNEPLLTNMLRLRQARETRLQKILGKLKEHGILVQVEECDPKNRAVGRPHVAKAMVAKGYVQGVQEAFDKYLGRGKSCYVPQPKLTPLEAVHLIHGAGGLAVLAHPEEVGDRELIAQIFAAVPLDGLEVYHPSARNVSGAFQYWQEFAAARGKFITGGSDFHGHTDRYPTHLGEFAVQSEWLEKFWQQPVIKNFLR
jgi:predicted metal-dependent phosphoesterase TrpH